MRLTSKARWFSWLRPLKFFLFFPLMHIFIWLGFYMTSAFTLLMTSPQPLAPWQASIRTQGSW